MLYSLKTPTVMTAVPLILDRVRKGIMDRVNNDSPYKRALVNHCLQYKRRWTRWGYRTPICDAVVFKKVAAAMGGQLRGMISGGAPLSADTHEFIRIALCISVAQGYGETLRFTL
jgi:long-chain acyl-CoA synthetase